jgi:hypothetical protein
MLLHTCSLVSHLSIVPRRREALVVHSSDTSRDTVSKYYCIFVIYFMNVVHTTDSVYVTILWCNVVAWFFGPRGE